MVGSRSRSIARHAFSHAQAAREAYCRFANGSHVLNYKTNDQSSTWQRISTLVRARFAHLEMRRAAPLLSWIPRVRAFSTMTQNARGYAEAIDALNSLQSNAATIEAVRRSGKTVNEFNEPEMTEYLERIGHKRADLDRIHVIHITGTKGKGSTAAFCDALLRQVRPAGSGKIGLYTSPHMVAVRERIRIDGVPLSESDFSKYFWEVWDSLEARPERQFEMTPLRPVYFRFMTLLAFHVFISLQVSATLLEVGIGGMYDSTNIVQHPVVTGVSPLGLDHTAILGNTLEEIAVQKAGIFKQDAPAYSSEQPQAALAELEKYAKKVRASEFHVVRQLPGIETVALGLPGDHQQINASLAVALVQAFASSDVGRAIYPGAEAQLGANDDCALSPAVRRGLEQAFWPGRCQTVPAAETAGANYYLDGAHTVESIELCVRWFAHQVAEHRAPHMLVFNCTNGRSGRVLLGAALSELEKLLDGGSDAPKHARTFFNRVYFCTNNTFAHGGSASGTYKDRWN